MKNVNNFLFYFLILFISISVILMIFSIWNIWKEKKVEESINKFSKVSFERKTYEAYKNDIISMLTLGNTDKLIDKLDNSFLDKIKIERNEKDKIVDYLKDQNLICPIPEITNLEFNYNEKNEQYLYIITYKSNGETKKMYLNESEPFEYTIEFEVNFVDNEIKNVNSLPTIAKKNTEENIDGINFVLSVEEATSQNIRYNVKITNNSKKTIKFDFNDITNVELFMNDGSIYKLASVVVSSDENYKLPPNSFINRELFFNVPIERQGEISSIVFYNVDVDGVNKKMIVNI